MELDPIIGTTGPYINTLYCKEDNNEKFSTTVQPKPSGKRRNVVLFREHDSYTSGLNVNARFNW